MKNLTEPIHPGEIFADELEAIGMTAAALALRIGVPKNRLYEIVNEQRGMTAPNSQFFRLNAQYKVVRSTFSSPDMPETVSRPSRII